MANETIIRVILDDDKKSDKKLNKVQNKGINKESKNRERNIKDTRYNNKSDEVSIYDIDDENNIEQQTPNKSITKKVTRSITGMSTLATTGYGLYSQHMSTGYNLSGARHQADIQNRRAQTAQFGASMLASTLINPALMPIVIGMKAWQQAQSNRQALYKINASQATARIMEDLFVKDTMERRF